MAQHLPSFVQEYFSIILFIGIACCIALFVTALPFVLSKQKPDKNKLAPYECGFEAFSDVRREFDVRFYLVAILFIIFDIEVIFLFPWAITLSKTGFLGFLSMALFLFILTIGFIYEWGKGALDW